MFSELVDTVVQSTARVDKLNDIIRWANLTIKELGGRELLHKNLVEDTLTVTADPFIWERPDGFQKMQTAQYATGIFPDYVPPGKRQSQKPNRYYAASTYYVFTGPDMHSGVNVAFYKTPIEMIYFVAGQRPMSFDARTRAITYNDLSGISAAAPYNLNYNASLALQEQARNLCMHWILQDWYDLIIEGTLAKVFKGVNDETRAATHFSFFERTYTNLFLPRERVDSMGV